MFPPRKRSRFWQQAVFGAGGRGHQSGPGASTGTAATGPVGGLNPSGGFLLLANATDHLLLADGASSLLLAGGTVI